MGGPGDIKIKVVRLSFAAVAASLIGNYKFDYQFIIKIYDNYNSFIGGTTLHSGLGFQFGSNQQPLAKEKLDRLKKELEKAEVVIIDEMSMISVDHFYHVHKRLFEIFDSKDDFGGRALLMVGDILQLAPVKGRPIYCRPKSSKNLMWMNMRDNNR